MAKDSWKRRYNNELYDMVGVIPVTSWIKGQRLHRLGYIMRRGENNILKSVMEWEPPG